MEQAQKETTHPDHTEDLRIEVEEIRKINSKLNQFSREQWALALDQFDESTSVWDHMKYYSYMIRARIQWYVHKIKTCWDERKR